MESETGNVECEIHNVKGSFQFLVIQFSISKLSNLKDLTFYKCNTLKCMNEDFQFYTVKFLSFQV